MSLYRNILKKAWEITWHNKYLWFFGLFVALLGNGGEFEIISRSFDINSSESILPSLKDLAATGIFTKGALANIAQLAVNDPFNLLFVIVLLLVIAALVCFVIWLTIVGQGGLVNNAANIITGKSHNLKGGIMVGIKKFWPVFSMNVIIKAIIYLIFITIGLPVVISLSKSSALAASIVFIVSFLIFIPIAIVLSFIIKYAIGYLIIKENKFFESLKMGWNLFLKNWLISLEMAFILFFINFFVGLALIMILLIFSIPFMFLAMVLIKTELYFNFWIIMMLALVVLLAIIALVGSALATFQTSAWIGLYIELIGKGGIPKIVRLFDKKT